VLAGGFYGISVPSLPEKWERIAAGVPYGVTVLLVAALFVQTSVSDPSEYGIASSAETDQEQYYCVLCEVHVRKQSKHCRTCNRCVEDFDHHCKWLNNCIGGKNYAAFFWLVVATCLMILEHFATGMYLFVSSFTRRSDIEDQLGSAFGGGLGVVGFRAAQGFFCALCILPAILLGELLMFHILLQYKGMSTYDYIMAQREAKANLCDKAEDGDTEEYKSPPRRKAVWRLKIFDAGGVHSEARSPKKVRVGLSPIALLKMKRGDRSSDGGFCGCGSPLRTPARTAVHPGGRPAKEAPSPAEEAPLPSAACSPHDGPAAEGRMAGAASHGLPSPIPHKSSALSVLESPVPSTRRPITLPPIKPPPARSAYL